MHIVFSAHTKEGQEWIFLKKLISLLLCALLLVTPMLASAESEGSHVFFRLSDPIIKLGEMTGAAMDIDLTGLELNFAAEEAADGFHLLAEVLANGVSGLAGHASLTEEGLFATVKGMPSAITVPMSAIEMLAEEFMAEFEAEMGNIAVIGGADGPTDVFVTEGFAEEDVAKFTTECEKFVSAIEVSDPVSESTTLEDGTVLEYESVEYSVGVEPIADLIAASYELLMTNPDFAQGFAEGLAESGAELENLSADDIRTAIIEESGISGLEGTIATSDNGDIIADNYIMGPTEDDYVNVEFSILTTDAGKALVINVYPDDVSALEIYGTMEESQEVEGTTDFYLDILACEYEDDVYTELFDLTVMVSNVYFEDNLPGVVVDLFATEEGEDVFTFSVAGYSNEEMHGAYVSVSVPDGSSTIGMGLGYDGYVPVDGNGSGQIWGTMMMDEEVAIDFVADVEYGAADGSIAYDYSGLNLVDLTTATEDDLSTLETELTNVAVMGAMAIANAIPFLQSLMASMM